MNKRRCTNPFRKMHMHQICYLKINHLYVLEERSKQKYIHEILFENKHKIDNINNIIGRYDYY
jgi:hypothetical protein